MWNLDAPIWSGPSHDYPKGATLFRQGQLVAEVFRITAGMIKLACTDRDGHESILRLALPGEWLGLAPVLADHPTPVSAHACSPVVVQSMSAQAFRRRVQDDPVWSFAVHRLQSHELCRQMRWIGQLGGARAAQRLRRVLRQLIVALHGEAAEQGVRLVVPLQQWELARLLAITPEHLSRLLRELESEGLIRREKGSIVIPDVEGLCPGGESDDAAWLTYQCQ